MKAWLSVAEAALVVGRHQSRIYKWIEAGILDWRKDADGVLVVSAAEAQRVESETKRGRPRHAGITRL